MGALASAVAELQGKGIRCDLVDDVVPRMYYKDQVKACEKVLKLHDSQYDVGFQMQEDGSLLPVFDKWNNHIKDVIGSTHKVKEPTAATEALSHIGQLMQQYSRHAALNEVTNQGYVIEQDFLDEDGNYQLVAGVYA